MSKRKAEDDLWDRHKDQISELYRTQRLGLPKVMQIMSEQHGFIKTKSQYERNFTRWNWRQNLKKGEWEAIQDHERKRKASGKPPSDLVVGDKHIPKDKVRRGVARHGHQTIFERLSKGSNMDVLEDQHKIPVRSVSPSLDDLYREFLNDSLGNIPSRHLVMKLSRVACEVKYLNDDHPLAISLSDYPQLFQAWSEDANELVARSVPFVANRVIRTASGPIPPLRQMETLASTNARYQQAFLELAISLKSNSQKDRMLDDLIIGLLYVPRNLRLLERLLNLDIPSTRAFADELLFPAVERGNIKLVSCLIACGVDPFFIRQEWSRAEYPAVLSALQLAVESKHPGLPIAILRSLVPRTAELANKKREIGAAIRTLIRADDATLIRTLGQHLPRHIFHEHLEARETLVTFYDAGRRGNLDTLRYLLGCLTQCVEHRLKVLDSILVGAAAGGHAELVEDLIQQGADPNRRLDITTSNLERTALGAATWAGHTNTVQCLLLKGANPNLPDVIQGNGSPPVYPLSHAIVRHYDDIVRLLLRGGADPNLRMSTKPGEGAYPLTKALPLVLAALEGSEEIFFHLVHEGARGNIHNLGVEHVRGVLDCGSPVIIAFILASGDWSNPLSTQLLLEATITAKKPPRALLRKFLDHGHGLDDPRMYATVVKENNLPLLKSLVEKTSHHFRGLPRACGAWALSVATSCRFVPIVKYLLGIGVTSRDWVMKDVEYLTISDANVDLSTWGSPFTALFHPGRANQNVAHNIQLLLLLIRGGLPSAEDTNSGREYHFVISAALSESIRHGYWYAVGALVQAGAGPYMTLSSSHVPNLQAIPYLRSALAEAVHRGDVAKVKYFLGDEFKHGHSRDLERSLGEALYLGICSRRLKLTKLLLEHGADPNLGPVHPVADHAGMMSCLSAAVHSSNPELVQLLLNYGANPDTPKQRCYRCSDMTALERAAISGNMSLVKLLLGAGATLNRSLSSNGATALTAAAGSGRLDITAYLLQVGANVEGKDNRQYQDAVWEAWVFGHHAIARMILQFKAETFGPKDGYTLDEIIEKGERGELLSHRMFSSY